MAAVIWQYLNYMHPMQSTSREAGGVHVQRYRYRDKMQSRRLHCCASFVKATPVQYCNDYFLLRKEMFLILMVHIRNYLTPITARYVLRCDFVQQWTGNPRLIHVPGALCRPNEENQTPTLIQLIGPWV